MSRKEDTSIGGDQRNFQTTHWTAIEQVRAGHPDQTQILIGELLDRMVADVKAQCLRDGMAIHWSLFRDRVLRPILGDRTPTLTVSRSFLAISASLP